MKKTTLAICVSGGGTNCENIINYFKSSADIDVSIVISSRADAFAITRAQRLGVPTTVITRQQWSDSDLVSRTLSDCDYVILAGFLVHVPEYLIEMYPDHIINIHPSLLPKYGGRGMYGHHVHEAVAASGDKETGITIHFVNKDLDAGEIIEQFRVPLTPDDTPDTIADKIHTLEQAHFPQVIERVIRGIKK